MNKTIIGQNVNSIRKRNYTRVLEREKNIKRTPAVVQEVVHIVNQKKAYHKLRNLGV
jgi:hypothetical protein